MNLERVRAAMERRPAMADVALAAGVALVGLFITLVLVVPNATFPPPPMPVIVVWGVALVAPLVLRRRFPVAVLVITGAHFMGYWAVGQPNEIGAWLVLGVALYSAAAHGPQPRAGQVAAALTAVMALVIFGLLVGTRTATPTEALAAITFHAVPFAVAWPLGAMMRSLRETRASLVERNRQLAEERERNARQAIVDERVRIARELHDVVAHHVSVIGVQAGVARRLFGRRPQQAQEAIGSVEASSRQAIADLHQIVGFLRSHDDGGDDLAPQPDLERLPALIDQMRAAGLPIDYVEEGAAHRWPAAVELSAFRIVQEALTNVLKHAGPSPTTIRMRHEPDALDIEIVDGGSGGGTRSGATRSGAGENGGRGLAGMRERAALHGGVLEAGPCDGAGFRVHTRLHGAAS
jgi:signal transduction histidine kinase